jgi:hypothetical protein
MASRLELLTRVAQLSARAARLAAAIADPDGRGELFGVVTALNEAGTALDAPAVDGDALAAIERHLDGHARRLAWLEAGGTAS